MTKTKRMIGLVVGGMLAAALAFGPGFLNAQASAEALTSGVTADVAHHGRGGGNLIAATATVTGLTEQEVRTALQGGQTLAQIAEANGKTSADVIAAARTTLQAQLAQAVTDGKLTQAEADAKLAAFDASAEAQMTSTTLDQGRGPRGGGARLSGAQALVAATASVTGLTQDDVRTALSSGQTLAQIVEANGKTADAVIAAARTTYEQQLAQAVTDGKLTQAQADAKLAEFDASAPGWMTSALPGRGGPHGGDAGFGRMGGPKSLIAATASVTGLSAADVMTALRSGQTLAQIAEANGKTSADVIAAARSNLQQALTSAVSAGTLTQAQADAQLAAFDASAEGWMTSALQTNHRGPHGPGDQAPQQTPTQAAPTSNS